MYSVTAKHNDCSDGTELELELAARAHAAERAHVARGPAGMLDVAELEVDEGEAIERLEATDLEALDEHRARRVHRRAEEGEGGERLGAERVDDAGSAEGPVERELAQLDAALERVVERAGVRDCETSGERAGAKTDDAAARD